MKMQTIVGIYIFITRENFMLSSVKHEKKFYNLDAWKGVYSKTESLGAKSFLLIPTPFQKAEKHYDGVALYLP